MSLLKWTLAMAGTAVGLRYLSDRQRRRIASDSNRTSLVDRDDGRDADKPWSTTPGSTSGGASLGTGFNPGLGASTGATHTGIAGGGMAGTGQDDLSIPDSDLTRGGTSNRF